METQSAQQPPESERAEAPARRRPGRQAVQPAGSSRQDDSVLQHQIALALQPVLPRFQEQVAQSVWLQLQRAFHLDEQPVEEGPQPADAPRRSAEPQPDDGQLVSEQPARQVREEPDEAHDEVQAREETAQPKDEQPRQQPERPAGEDEEHDERPGSLERHGLGAVVQPLLKTIPDVMEEEGQQSVHDLVDALLDALFSDELRRTLQEEREETVRLLLDAGLEAIPDEESRREVRQQAEETLQPFLQESIDAIFSGRVRADFQRHTERAALMLLQGNSSVALREAGDGLERLFTEILRVLQRYWVQVLRVLLKVVFEALQETVESAIKEGLTDTVGKPAKEAGEGLDALPEKLEDKGEELQAELQDAVEKLRQRVEEGRDEIKQRVKEGVQSAVNEGDDGGRGFGFPPTGRPPSGRPPTGRPPSGRPPSLTSQPSGRPPSSRARST